MDGRRDAASKRRTIERSADALLVHGVASLVQRREQGVANVVLADAGGDADVASGKPGAERMVRKIEPAPLEIVTKALRNMQGKIKLGLFGKSLPQTGVVGCGPVADCAHHRYELSS